jgi:hypothetical protein
LLLIHEATTCSYRVTWMGWDPPRSTSYTPDADGWIGDYFILGGAHGQVFWNLRTNQGVVRPKVQGRPLSRAAALEVASWAHRTHFPGLHMERVVFNSSPCPPQACTPR